ncbi:MAG: hypothetical protein CSYNP_00810 [Syntrophus sp. SKADARSKE-3]|nr:hypothetical protein [Syntrophus sp. SKADARSKE-3]
MIEKMTMAHSGYHFGISELVNGKSSVVDGSNRLCTCFTIKRFTSGVSMNKEAYTTSLSMVGKYYWSAKRKAQPFFPFTFLIGAFAAAAC